MVKLPIITDINSSCSTGSVNCSLKGVKSPNTAPSLKTPGVITGLALTQWTWRTPAKMAGHKALKYPTVPSTESAGWTSRAMRKSGPLWSLGWMWMQQGPPVEPILLLYHVIGEWGTRIYYWRRPMRVFQQPFVSCRDRFRCTKTRSSR